MKKKLTIKQRIKACFILLVSGSFCLQDFEKDAKEFADRYTNKDNRPQAESNFESGVYIVLKRLGLE